MSRMLRNSIITFVPLCGGATFMALKRVCIDTDETNDHFHTDCYVSGDTFIKKSNNQYFTVINKKYTDSNNYSYFVSSDKMKNIKETFPFYDDKKHYIVRLNFDRNKEYFIESNQDISVVRMPEGLRSSGSRSDAGRSLLLNASDTSSYKILDDDEIKQLLENPPKFEPLPGR
jgi:hypothetical protein